MRDPVVVGRQASRRSGRDDRARVERRVWPARLSRASSAVQSGRPSYLAL